MDDLHLDRYSRHLLLDDIGLEGQEKLLQAHVAIVGLGGLGSPAAMYLAAAGVGTITLCDGDTVDLTNLQRQIAHTTAAVGSAKTESAATTLRALNPHCKLRLSPRKMDAVNADDIVGAADAVVDAGDNYAVRHLVGKTCVRQKKPHIFAAAVGFEAQLSVFDHRREESPCYNCLFSEKDEAAETRCALMGVFAPLVGMVGCWQAAETVKLIACAHLPSPCGRLVLLDGRRWRWREVHLRKDPACAVCGGN